MKSSNYNPKDLLISIIKPDFTFKNVYYPNPDESGNYTELDILLGVDDILFLVEIIFAACAY
ncbi:MAG: hypothetical protein NTV89_08175 [Proteobacteria bacterium]|nr:hypothetical protein [Pseudomonadota bacterium]